MEKTLAYLREILSNYTEYHEQTPRIIYHKLIKNAYKNEEEFVRDLSQKEIAFLDRILPNEIRYAMDEKDFERVYQLNEVYELLF
ncbi:MAG TPA: sigma-G-dependent sporulation-specific acid-soluble spore protein CsgA [Anoxybacillus sp.]|nr:sigma-G-dependent sporulation-specific acid-soluble spore protein CsgA [Anoxybacillus sp.]